MNCCCCLVWQRSLARFPSSQRDTESDKSLRLVSMVKVRRRVVLCKIYLFISTGGCSIRCRLFLKRVGRKFIYLCHRCLAGSGDSGGLRVHCKPPRSAIPRADTAMDDENKLAQKINHINLTFPVALDSNSPCRRFSVYYHFKICCV